MQLRLLWPVDLKKYRIEPGTPPSGRTIAESVSGGPNVVRNGGKLDFQDRFKVDGLWRRLADTEPTEDGVLDFMGNYGFLRSTRRGESLSFICNEIEVMRNLVVAIEREDWLALDQWLLNNRNAIRLGAEFHQEKGWPRPDLFFGPRTMMDAIYLQALQDATSGTDLRKCDRPGCPEYRAVGPGTGRWRTKRPVFYCTPTCQKAHAYMKLKGESK